MSREAIELLVSLPLEDGRRWGEVATDVQLADARALLDPGPDDRPFAYLTRARGYSKTTDLAGVEVAALASGLLVAGGQAFAAAGDRDQAALLVREMAGFVNRAGLGDVLEVQTWQVVGRSSSASLVALAADGPTAFGLRPRRLVVDELGQWSETTRTQLFWEALWSSVGKVPDCRATVITTEPAPGTLGHRVLQAACESPAWRVHRVPGPPPWMSEAAIEEQRRLLLPSAFRRLILNEPDVADEDRLTSFEDLEAAVDEGRVGLEPVPGRHYVIAVDLGLRRDRTVMAVAHREQDPDGEWRTVVDRLQRWVPRPGAEVDLREVEETIVFAARLYGASVTLDPWQAALLAQRLRAERVKVHEFPFTTSSVGRLAFGLFSALQNRRLSLPDDPELVDELLNVRLRTNSAGTVRMDHASGGHDDQAVTIALAIHALAELPARRRRGVRAGGGRPVRRTKETVSAQQAHAERLFQRARAYDEAVQRWLRGDGPDAA